MAEIQTDAETLSAEAGSQAASSSQNKADLGILLVHGIGQSRTGETLKHFGEPLVQWIAEWVGLNQGAEVEVVDGTLGNEPESPTSRAHARLKITAPAIDSAGPNTKEWLIAESWWAESFIPPTFNELANWGFKIVPWTIFFHFHHRFSEATGRFSAAFKAQPRQMRQLLSASQAVVWELFWVVLSILYAPVLLAALAIILLLGMIPVPQVRSFVGKLQRGLALTVGDSYSLLAPRVAAASIYGRVNRDLDWLLRHAENVAVVAHSQGAAVAYRVVSRRQSEQCKLFVTFGAGIRKLVQIRQLSGPGTGRWVVNASLALIASTIALYIANTTLGLRYSLLIFAAVPVVFFTLSFSLGIVLSIIAAITRKANLASRVLNAITSRPQLTAVFGWSLTAMTVAGITLLFPGETRSTTIPVAILVSVSLGWLAAAYQTASRHIREVEVMQPSSDGRAHPMGETPLPQHTRWVDLYATCDPVPNGALFDRQQTDRLSLSCEAQGLTSMEVDNRESLVTDHTTYWKNAESFIATVAGELGALCGQRLANVFPLDDERLTIARHMRRRRVTWLKRSRWILILGLIGVWQWGNLEQYGIQLLNALVEAGRAIPLVGGLIESAISGTVPSSSNTEMLSLAVGGVLAAGVIFSAWSYWDYWERTLLIMRLPNRQRAPAEMPFHLAWLATLVTVALLIADIGSIPWWSYVVVAIASLVIASAISVNNIYRGDVADVWTRLMKKLDLWSQELHDLWVAKVATSQTVVVDANKDDAGQLQWRIRTTLVWYIKSPMLTHWRGEHTAATLREAANIGHGFNQTVFVMTGESQALQVEQLIDGAYPPAPAAVFWTYIIKNYAGDDIQLSEARVLRAQAFDRLGDPESAIDDYAAVIAMQAAAPDDLLVAYMQRGYLRQVRGDAAGAIDDYTHAIELPNITPEQKAGLINLRAQCHSQLGDGDAAEADYRSVTVIPEVPDGEAAIAFGNLGWMAFERGDHAAFLSLTKQAFDHDPTHCAIGFNLGLALLLNGSGEDAVMHYRKIAQDCPAAEAIRSAIDEVEQIELPSAEVKKSANQVIEGLRSRLREIEGEASKTEAPS